MKKLHISGVIIADEHKSAYDFYEVKSTCPNDIISQLQDNEDVEIIINSGGGNVFAGAEIYTALKEHKGKVIVKVSSFAGSSASIIMCAGDEVYISPVAQVMIHNVSVKSDGNYNAHEHIAKVLKNANETIANAYTIKTGLSHEQVLEMMNNETWLSPQKAIELGFADKMLYVESNSYELVASALHNEVLPQNLINEFNNKRTDSLQKNEVDFLFAQNQAKEYLEILKLKEIKKL